MSNLINLVSSSKERLHHHTMTYCDKHNAKVVNAPFYRIDRYGCKEWRQTVEVTENA